MSQQAATSLVHSAEGLFCPSGDFFVDPPSSVGTAVLTHAHSDHARVGSQRYIAHRASEGILRSRLGADIHLDLYEYGERIQLGKAWVSLHPAGHVLGASQVRIETPTRHGGSHVAVISGDYKRQSDNTCTDFEVVECDHFVTESTFGLPAFHWPDTSSEVDRIHRWWKSNQDQGRASLLMAYALGKSQRLLSLLDATQGPIFIHGALQAPTECYRSEGVELPRTQLVREAPQDMDWSRAIILAVPSANGTPWVRRFGKVSTAIASGWMAIRGPRRRRSVDRGFVISDHVDWPALLMTVEQTTAKTIWITHGFADIVARYLSEQGYDATPLRTQFEGEVDDSVVDDSDIEAES